MSAARGGTTEYLTGVQEFPLVTQATGAQAGGQMAADTDHPSIPAMRLAERLRRLREQEHLTQKQLARALGGSITAVSMWEKPGSDRLPPPTRLAAYARLFCTSRSFSSGAPRLLRDDELTAHDQEQEAVLYDELMALRERASSTASAAEPTALPSAWRHGSIWNFRSGTAVSIVDSVAPDPPPYASQTHMHYSQYARFADLDALIEIFAQVKADNPTSMIRPLSPDELTQDFALNHLVIVGGAALREVSKETPWFAKQIDVVLPVAQQAGDTYFFECSVGEEKRKFESLYIGGVLTQDVGLIARVPHPIMPEKTVTVLSGITSRGVHGAALCFTDWHVRGDNERYLQETFGDTDSFCIMMNIPVANNTALPANLRFENIRVYEWSTETGARW
jgi:transcriptional regulator with XRE-family HTH domain